MRKLTILIGLIIILVSAYGTHREIFNDKGVWAQITIDWSKANINPNGASVWIFPHDGGKPIVFLTNDTRDSVKLRRGKYSLLVFNETITEHQFIRFRGTNHYSTFEAYCKPTTVTGKYVKADSDPSASTPNLLASDHLDYLEITTEMIENNDRPQLNFTPKRVVSLVSITIHIQGVENAAKSGSAVSLSGIAEGVNLSTGKRSSSAVRHMAPLNNREFYPENPKSGTLSASFNTFGLTDMQTRGNGVENLISIYIKLRDGSSLPTIERNVTDKIERVEGVELKFKITMGAENLPEFELPDVPDANISGPGFDAEVEDWGEEENVDLPI